MNETHIKVHYEGVEFLKEKKSSDSLLLKANEIDFLKLCKYHIDTNYTDPIAIQPDIIE